MFENRITRLFGIRYPIIQAGMIWAFDAVEPDAARASTFSRRFFTKALEAELLLRPIGRTVYLMPPYVLSDDESNGLAERTLRVFNSVMEAA